MQVGAAATAHAAQRCAHPGRIAGCGTAATAPAPGRRTAPPPTRRAAQAAGDVIDAAQGFLQGLAVHAAGTVDDQGQAQWCAAGRLLALGLRPLWRLRARLHAHQHVERAAGGGNGRADRRDEDRRGLRVHAGRGGSVVGICGCRRRVHGVVHRSLVARSGCEQREFWGSGGNAGWRWPCHPSMQPPAARAVRHGDHRVVLDRDHRIDIEIRLGRHVVGPAQHRLQTAPRGPVDRLDHRAMPIVPAVAVGQQQLQEPGRNAALLDAQACVSGQRVARAAGVGAFRSAPAAVSPGVGCVVMNMRRLLPLLLVTDG